MAWLSRALRLHLLSNQFPALHGLRALAIVSVVQVHVSVSLGATGLMHDSEFFLRSTDVWFGMDLFFFLSGFLIGTLLLPAQGASGAARPGMLRFYVRRAFRIVPNYYFVLTTLVLLAPLVPEQRAALPWEYAYLTNYHVFSAPPVMPWAWSLAVEEHFYLAVPILAALLARLPRPPVRIAVLVLLWLSGLGVRLAVFYGRAHWAHGEEFAALYLPTHTRYDILVAGVLLAYVQRAYGPRLRKALEEPPAHLGLAAVVLACLAALMGPLAHRDGLHAVFAWGTVTSVMYFALVMLVLNTTSGFTRFLSSRAFLRFATLGYGIYLVHPPVISVFVVPVAMVLAGRMGLSIGTVWVVSLALLLLVATAVAYVLHVVVEKPALWLRDRLTGTAG